MPRRADVIAYTVEASNAGVKGCAPCKGASPATCHRTCPSPVRTCRPWPSSTASTCPGPMLRVERPGAAANCCVTLHDESLPASASTCCAEGVEDTPTNNDDASCAGLLNAPMLAKPPRSCRASIRPLPGLIEYRYRCVSFTF